MMKFLIHLLFLGLFAAGGYVEDGFQAQPEKIPGDWKPVPFKTISLDEVIARPLQERPVYGLYSWCWEYRTHRESVKKVGWRTVRIAGPFDDETMAMLCEDDMEVMKTLGARDISPTVEFLNRSNYASDEAFLTAYLAGIDRFLSRYGPGGTFFKDHPNVPVRPVVHVEILNEPNFQYMIPPREGTPRPVVEAEREALYAKVLPAAYKTIKAKWPDVTVLGFGAGGASAGDRRWIKNLHQEYPAVANSYDALSTHPYSRPLPIEAFVVKSWPSGGFSTVESLNLIRETLAEHGRGDAPIWYTEVGWPIAQSDGGRFAMADGLCVDPLLQAAYLCRLYALTMRLGVDRSLIMFITDSDHYNAGFFLPDGTWRPSAHAVQHMIRLMPNPGLAGALSDGVNGFFAYEFISDTTQVDSPRVTMLWNMAEPKLVELSVATPTATIIDLFGIKRTVRAINGTITVEAGPCPLYVTVLPKETPTVTH